MITQQLLFSYTHTQHGCVIIFLLKKILKFNVYRPYTDRFMDQDRNLIN